MEDRNGHVQPAETLLEIDELKFSEMIHGRQDIDIRENPVEAIAAAHREIGALKMRIDRMEREHFFTLIALSAYVLVDSFLAHKGGNSGH